MKREYYDGGWVACEIWVDQEPIMEFFPDLDELRSHLRRHIPEEDWPTLAHTCVSATYMHLDLDGILLNMYGDNVCASDLKGVKELNEAFDVFNAANASLLSHELSGYDLVISEDDDEDDE